MRIMEKNKNTMFIYNSALKKSSKLSVICIVKVQKLKHYCSTTGKPTRSFATERVSLDSV